jgi:uncharacterized membrane protein
LTITNTIEIARSPEDVFAYMDDLSRHGEWQPLIVSVRVDTDGPTRVGSRATEVRRMGRRKVAVTYEITEHEPPHRFAFKGIDGAIRAEGKGTIDATDGGKASRLTLELTLTGYGVGKVFAPLARKQARRELPEAHRRLKELLESSAA